MVPHGDCRPLQIPLIVRIEIPADEIDQRAVAAEFGPVDSHDPVIGLIHAPQILIGGPNCRPAAIMRSDVDQGLGPDDRKMGHCCLIARDEQIAVRTS